jgi:competence protein ComEC
MEAEPRNFGPTTLRPASNAVGVPLFHAAWLFALGIVVADFIWLRPAYLLIALFPVSILCGIAALRAQRIAWAPLAVLWCLLGAWCAEMQPQPAAAPALAALSDGLVRNVEGTIVDAGPMREEVEQDDLRISPHSWHDSTSPEGGIRRHLFPMPEKAASER